MRFLPAAREIWTWLGGAIAVEIGVFFDSWSAVGKTLLVGALAYVALVLALRISGKRTLSKMNAFDLVVTVALGSTLSSIMLDNSIPLVRGVLALVLLIGLQYLVAWMSTRSSRVEHMVKAEPRVVLENGVFLDDALQRERLTRSEVEAAIRAEGLTAARDAHQVVLETNGELSVVPRATDDDRVAR